MNVSIIISAFLLIISGIFIPARLFAESLPDPTRPANISEVKEVSTQPPNELINWDVRAIRSSEAGRNAIVNGKLVKVGDEIDSATIVAITANTVVLRHDNKKLVLKLIPAEIKKVHSNTAIQHSE